LPKVALPVNKPTEWLRVVFCTETFRHINYSVLTNTEAVCRGGLRLCGASG